MKYNLIFKKQVKKFIEKQDKDLKHRFKEAFLKLAKKPYPTNLCLDIKKLKATSEYRLRIGKYRFIYQIEKDVLIIIIEKANSRGDIYK